MQYLNTAYGREERERDTGVPEYTEKMTFKYNTRGGDSKVVVRVKKGQKVGAGDELRVAYGWTSKAWGRVIATFSGRPRYAQFSSQNKELN